MTKNYLGILAETIRNNWDQPALTDFYLTEDGKAQDTSRGNHYTYGEMYAEIVRVADLLTHLGLQKGDHIAICGANSAHWVIAYLTIAKMQGVSVTIMHSLQPDEIAHLVNFSDAKALFVDPDIYNSLHRSILGDLSSVIALDDWSILRGKQIINHQSPIINGECKFPSLSPKELSQICFTSGTSGCTKGVMIPYMAHNVGMKSMLHYFPIFQENKNLILVLPIAHILGLADIISALGSGCHIYILQPEAITTCLIPIIMQIQPHRIMIIPMVLDKIISSGKICILEQWKVFLKYCVTGGTSLSIEAARKMLNIKFPLTIAYGTTETSLISLSSPMVYKIGSCGKVIEDTKVCIAPNGEILVKGENVMLGYYKDPEATAQKIDADGWLHTGDKGHLDEDGYLYVEGRLEQDIIVLPNGENIRPDNIEALINALPEVKESIVLARDGKLVAIVVSDQQSVVSNQQSEVSLRREILRTVNPQLPLFSQLYDVEITDQPLARTEKQTIKRYLYS